MTRTPHNALIPESAQEIARYLVVVSVGAACVYGFIWFVSLAGVAVGTAP